MHRFVALGLVCCLFGRLGRADEDVGRVAISGPPAPIAPEVISRDESGGATVRAIRLRERLVVDGKLDEELYRRHRSISGFIQQEPHEGAPATEKTEVWIFFDDRNVYVSARCWDSHPERMVANEMRRDNNGLFNNENFAVLFDTFYDRRNGAFFYTTPLGALSDGLVTDESSVNKDWNGIWQVKTALFENGWTVEMAFPFKTLRYESSGPQVWGINFRRTVRWKNEHSFLTSVPASFGPTGILQVSQAGTLVGLATPPKSGNLEVKPYGITSVVTDNNAAPPESNDLGADAGFDLKYGVSRSLIADFTFNTDFAQVEADEQQVNLTRFSLFFPEKREFFLEGQGIFGFGGATNRARPDFLLTAFRGQNPNVPILFFSRRIGLGEDGVIPILAGGRLTGRAGSYSVGLLTLSTDDHEPSETPQTNYSVVRVKRDILRRSSIGLMGTNRSVATSGEGSNQAFGVDANLAFFEHLRVNGYYAVSQTTDRGGDATSYRAQLDYNSDEYGVQLDRLVVQENFNPEIGFVRRENFQQSFASFRYSPRPRSIAAIRKVGWLGSLDYTTDNDGRLETRIQKLEMNVDFENSDVFLVEYRNNFEFLPEPFEIFPEIVLPVAGYDFQDLRFTYQLGTQRRLSGNVAFQTGGFFSGTRDELSYRGRLEVTPKLSIEPGIAFNRIDLEEGSFTTELVTTRVNYTMTPRSFVAALIQYNSRASSLSSNIRLRWEYRPGSELFLVYSDQRDTLTPGFPGLENRSFVVKVTRLFRF